MPRLGYMIIDGLAFVLVGVGLTAAIVGYERNLPDPAAHVAAVATDWADPVTTGSIAPTAEEAESVWAEPPAMIAVEAVGRSAAQSRKAWVDPPRR